MAGQQHPPLTVAILSCESGAQARWREKGKGKEAKREGAWKLATLCRRRWRLAALWWRMLWWNGKERTRGCNSNVNSRYPTAGGMRRAAEIT